MPLPDAARALGLPWAAAWNLYLAGHLQGEKRNGRYHVSVESVEQYRKTHPDVGAPTPAPDHPRAGRAKAAPAATP